MRVRALPAYARKEVLQKIVQGHRAVLLNGAFRMRVRANHANRSVHCLRKTHALLSLHRLRGVL